jgi:hypothetical protein
MTEYSDLSSKIISFTEVSSSVFSDTVVDYLLENAQHRMMREVDLPVFRRTDTGTLTASSPFVALPVNCLIIRSFHYLDGSSNNVFLLPKERSYCIEYGKKRSTTGTPKYYARYDEDKLYIAPTPSSALSFELSYTVKPNAIDSDTLLSSSSTSSWLSTNCKDVLFNACMVEAYAYLKGPADMIQMWEQKYQQSLQGLSIEEQGRTRRDEYRHGELRTPVRAVKP